MAEKDRDKRGKEERPAYFVPVFAQSYACFGRLGHYYLFSKKSPLRVTLEADKEMFRLKQDVAECDSGGRILEQGSEQKPLSYTKTAPPETSEEGDTVVLTTDKPRKDRKPETEPAAEEAEAPKKAKKKAPKLAKKKAKKEAAKPEEEKPEKESGSWFD